MKMFLGHETDMCQLKVEEMRDALKFLNQGGSMVPLRVNGIGPLDFDEISKPHTQNKYAEIARKALEAFMKERRNRLCPNCDDVTPPIQGEKDGGIIRTHRAVFEPISEMIATVHV